MNDLWEKLQEYGFKGTPNAKGQIYNAKCPFCNGNFSININSGLFKCFSGSCGVAGHVSRFIGNCYPDIRELDENDLVSFDFGDISPCLDFNDYVVSELELGQYQWLHPYLVDRGFEKDFLIKNKIGYSKEHYRVTIPIFLHGKYYGVIKRTVLSDIQPKYLYPDNLPKKHIVYRPLFRKNYDNFVPCMEASGGSFNGLDFSKVLLIVEGSLDALKQAQNGFNAAALLGCQMSVEQSKLIGRICKLEGLFPILMLDGDKAGIEGIKRIVNDFPTFNCKIVRLDKVALAWYGNEGGNGGAETAKIDPGELTREQTIQILEDPNFCQDVLDFLIDGVFS